MIVRREPAAIALVPLVAIHGRLVPAARRLEAGDALWIGDVVAAVPDLASWSVAAPRGSSAMVAIPLDPTRCETWIDGLGGSSANADAATAREVGRTCVVRAGALELAATPLVPDDPAVFARGVRAAIAIGAPALLLLIALAASRRRGRRAPALGRALRLCVLGGGLAALACWRLVWAHRIDAMHGDAARVLDNELAVLAIGAALAGNAVLAIGALDGTPARQRLAWAIGAWAAWLAIGFSVGFVDGLSPFGLAFGDTAGLVHPAIDARTIGVVGLSAIAATTPVLASLASRAGRRIPIELGLAAIAACGWLAHAMHARGALTKLGLAYATVLVGHAALRAMVETGTPIGRRARLALALATALGAVALLDAGVALAVAGVGLGLAMLVAGHDATYDASQAGRIGVLEREHARLLLAHGVVAAALAIGVAIYALTASDRTLLEDGTLGALHAPLVAVLLFALAAAIARSHRRRWAPWLVAALAALAAWGARDGLLARATAGHSVGARRVAAVVDPGYALLRDDRAFVASASAWREVVPPRPAHVVDGTIDASDDDRDAATDDEPDRWNGQGYFGARIRDRGVAHSIDNDYFPVLMVRERGIGGLLQSVALLLVLIVGAGALASVRLPHASRAQRARWLVTGVVGTLAVYQPLASLGVLPLTGITWPGLGIDSPGDLWLFVIGAIWCVLGGETWSPDLGFAVSRSAGGALARSAREPSRNALPAAEARVRATPRVARARRIVIGALVICGASAVVLVARGGASAQARRSADDRIDVAVRYAHSLACAKPSLDGDTLAEVISPAIAGRPTDGATSRFEHELATQWPGQRAALLRALMPANDPRGLACPEHAGEWTLRHDGHTCIATRSLGWPAAEIAVVRSPHGLHATCRIELPDGAVSQLARTVPPPRERIRVVAAPIGIATGDVGEVVVGARVIRLRPDARSHALSGLAPGVTAANELVLDHAVLAVRPSPRGVVLRGAAELFVADAERRTWRRSVHGDEVVLDQVSLVVTGPVDRRTIVLFRPPRAWAGHGTTVDTLLADDAGPTSDGGARRLYPHGNAVPELGWVNPYGVERSLGLDGWIHAYRATAGPSTGSATAPACGTLSPPPIEERRVCSKSPLDGVLECRVTIQPALVLALRKLVHDLVRDPKPLTGRDVTPTRVGIVALRGDTGEVLAQIDEVTGRAPLAFAPVDARAEAALVRLRDQPGEAEAERVDWNLPIAVGSTFKPIVARAAERAAPAITSSLTLTAAGHAAGCRARRGRSVDPIVGHCPPTSLAGTPTTADLHDFLAHSPNWFQAALGIVGLGLPAQGIQLSVRGVPVTLADVVQTDLATWPTDAALEIADTRGPILTRRSLVLDGLRRTPLWSNVETLLGRPTCTLGDRRSCERAATRADVCAARALPIAAPGADLRNLVALGPDRLDLYAGDRPRQRSVPVREYLQLLRGSGVHAVGSLAQITDAFGRVVYDPEPTPKLAASWFPAPAVGTIPTWNCAHADARTTQVRGAGGGLCAVVQAGGTAHRGLAPVFADPAIAIYGAKTGTVDSLAGIARNRRACARWNASHVAAARLTCGRTPPDDSLLVIAFGVVTPDGVVPITLGLRLQRGGTGSATHTAPAVMRAIVDFVRGK